MRPRSLILSSFAALSAVFAVAHFASGCAFRSAEDCELTLGFGCTSTSSSATGTGGAGTGGTGTGGTTSSTTSSSGTGGEPPICLDPSLCPDVPAGPCASLGMKVCDKGKCAVAYMDAAAPSQAYGSCKTMHCDATGKLSEEPDDSNLYDDGNPCTLEACTEGVPSSTQLFKDACMVGGASGVCLPDPYILGLVTCSECDPNGPPTCIGGATCVKGKCVPPQCGNNFKDSGESDVDCGGTNSGCLKCGVGKACVSGATDCLSGVCTMGKCVAATCGDGVQNADETDADCSGVNCPDACADGRKCVLPTDCQSKVCVGNFCQAPTCTDGVQNGDEEGLDCGGATSLCPPCAK